MNIGMLWFDNSKDPLQIKLQKAVDYYSKKYGRQPSVCYVNRQAIEPVKIEGLSVRPWRYMFTGHMWIGVAEA